MVLWPLAYHACASAWDGSGQDQLNPGIQGSRNGLEILVVVGHDPGRGPQMGPFWDSRIRV